MIKNKKSQIFEVLLPIVTLILCIGALILFFTNSNNLKISLASPAKLSNVYNDADKFMIFANEAGELAIMQAYYEMAKENSFADYQSVTGGKYPDHIELHGISPSIDQEFATKINEHFNNYLTSYSDERFRKIVYSISIDNNIVNFNSNTINLNMPLSEGFFQVGAFYAFNPSFNIDITKMGLDNMKRVIEISTDCYSKRNELNILECLKQLTNFDPSPTPQDDGTLFDLTTKERFFYNQDGKPLFEKIVIKFFIRD